MKSFIIFSFLIAVACAASLGHDSKATASPKTKTSVKPKLETDHDSKHHSGKHVSASELATKLVATNEIEGIHKLEETIESEKEVSKDALNVGARTLEAFSKVLSSGEIRSNVSSIHEKKSEKVVESHKPVDVIAAKKSNADSNKSKAHAANHVHSRQADGFIGSGSEIIQNGGLVGLNDGVIGIGNGGIVSSERLINTGGLVSSGNIINSNLASNGGLLKSGNLIYSQGLSGNGGLINTGRLTTLEAGESSGELISSSQILDSGRVVEPVQLVSTGGIIGSAPTISTGGLIQTGQVIGSGIQGGNSGVLINNYGNNQGILQNSGSVTKYTVGLDELDAVPQTVEYSKQFFNFEAPEEVREEGTITKELSNVLKKNLQVVFINAPENTASTNAALQLAKQAIEQRTAIYVLSKEAEAAQLVGQLEQIQENVQTAPEVRIVKYRTPEDLERAKLEIQSQYEATGGSTESFDGGVAPLLNYASSGLAQREIGTLLGPGIVSSTNIGNVVTAIDGSANLGVGQTIGLGKQTLLASSVGPVNVIKGSNIASGLGNSGVLISGSPNTYSSNLGSGLVLNSAPSTLVETGSLVVPSTSGIVASNSVQVPITVSSSQLGSGTLVKSNSGTSKYFGTGPLVSSNIGTSGSIGSNVVQSSNTVSSNQFGSGTLRGLNAGSSTLFKTTPSVVLSGGSSNSVSGGSSNILRSDSDLVYSKALGSNSVVGLPKPTFPVDSNVALKISAGDKASGSSALLDTYSLGSNDGFGRNSLPTSTTGLPSALSIGSARVPTSSPVTGSTVGLGFGTTGSGSLVGGQNLIAGKGSVIGSTTISPLTTISSFESGTGSSNTFGSGFLSGSNSGNKVSGTSSSFGSVPTVGSYASRLTVSPSKPSKVFSLPVSGSSNQNNFGNFGPGSGSSFNDNVSILSSTKIDRGQNTASGSGILLGSTAKSGGQYVSGLGIGSSIGEVVNIGNSNTSLQNKKKN